MKKRMQPGKRRSYILTVAIELSKTHGYRNITREEVAKASRVSESLINTYFGTIEELRQCVIRQAVIEEIPIIIAQHLAVADDNSINISSHLKELAAEYLRAGNAKNS